MAQSINREEFSPLWAGQIFYHRNTLAWTVATEISS